MSCPSCGAQLEISNQHFCQKCGSELPGFSKSSELEQKSSLSPENQKFYQLQQKSVRLSYSRHLSKRCLGFGIVSLILAVITFNMGSSLIMEPSVFYFLSRQNVFISISLAHLVGLMFGIVSRIFSKRAKMSEPSNTAMKAGSTLGSLGLILNIILMIVALSLVLTFF